MATAVAPASASNPIRTSAFWRILTLVTLIAGFNLIVCVLANALQTSDQIPETGRNAIFKLLGVADTAIFLYVIGQLVGGRTRYFLTRLAMGIGTVFVIATVVYFLLNALPGEKWYSHLVNVRNQTAAQRAAILHHYGLDRPLYVQFLVYLNQILQFPPDLGNTATFGGRVIDAIAVRAPATIVLMGTSYVLQVLIAIPIGVISAVKPYSRIDNFVTSFSFFGISLPNFWFGSMLIFIFAILPTQSGHASIFPVGGQHSNIDSELFSNIPDLAWHLVLPVTVLAVQGIAYYARYTRSAMLDVLGQDYIRTAWAKGLSGRSVILRHAFRNSLLPIITLAGLDIPQLFGGAIITEQVFNWQGMGQATVSAAFQGDYIFVTGVLLILATLVVLGNLLADLAYTIADPRISYERAH